MGGIMTENKAPTKNGYACTAEISTSIEDGFTLTAVGDIILTRSLNETFHKGIGEIQRILNASDITFGNFEGTITDSRQMKCSPFSEFGGAYHISLPAVAAYLKNMGFDMLSHANNHAMDWGYEGMRETQKYLDEAGIIYAGTGETLAQASAPRFMETDKGRVAMVSYTSSAPPAFRACDPVHTAPGRPGVATVRIKQYFSVTEDLLEDLKRVRDAISLFPDESSDPDTVSIALQLQDMTFKKGEVNTRCAQQNKKDEENILWNIRNGKQFSDFLFVSDHTHEPGNWYQNPPNYQPEMAHRFIDAGADAFIGHGSHHLRGIEIYQGKPIFYGLGDFIMDDLRTPVGEDMYEDNDQDPRFNTDADVNAHEMSSGYVGTPGFESPMFYQSVIAQCVFEHAAIKQIKLYPVELNQKAKLAHRGVPSLAQGKEATEILNRVQELSKHFGTVIKIEDGIGIIKL
jgi:poly-gamma-glutamate synthesis protein (capsule biosynthesis protein)